MRIHITSVMVDDQDKAQRFYTAVLGFQTKFDIPMGGARWLTLVSSEQPDGVELLLEPVMFPPAKTYQKELFEAGIPLTSFETPDIQKEYERMKGLGVVFRSEPQSMGPVKVANFEDTCGNLIQLIEKTAAALKP